MRWVKAETYIQWFNKENDKWCSCSPLTVLSWGPGISDCEGMMWRLSLRMLQALTKSAQECLRQKARLSCVLDCEEALLVLAISSLCKLMSDMSDYKCVFLTWGRECCRRQSCCCWWRGVKVGHLSEERHQGWDALMSVLPLHHRHLETLCRSVRIAFALLVTALGNTHTHTKTSSQGENIFKTRTSKINGNGSYKRTHIKYIFVIKTTGFVCVGRKRQRPSKKFHSSQVFLEATSGSGNLRLRNP